MGLVDDLGSPPTNHGTRPCSFRAWLDSLPAADIEAVQVALYRDRSDPLYWSSPKLHARLRSAGWSGSDSVIQTHRNRDGCKSCRSTI